MKQALFALLFWIGHVCALQASEPDFLLAEVMPKHLDPAAYLVSEKLDGVRAQWDGQQLRLRSGAMVLAPAWFLNSLPAAKLDGELWIARGQFERLSAAIRRADQADATWREINYMVFELPDAPGSFASRVQQIEQIISQAAFPQLQAVRQMHVQTRLELKALLRKVTQDGGEGLMLHLASAPYQTGRSDVLLKLKLADDAEATVVRHLPGKGRLTGMLGALEVQLQNGTVFRIGSGFSDAERRQPPAIGSQVTFRYRGWTRHGVPKFATFVRVRVLP